MSIEIPITDPKDEEALTAARSQLDAMKDKWKVNIRLIVTLKTVRYLVRFVQLILIARLLAGAVLKKSATGSYLSFILLIVLAGLYVCTGYLTDKISARFSKKIIDHVRISVLEQLEKGLSECTPDQKTGGAILFFGRQAEALAPYFTRYLPQQTLSLAAPLITLAYVFTISWVCGLIMLFTVPVLPVYMILIGKGTTTESRNEWENLTSMGGYFYDRIKGITTLYIFGAEDAEVKKMQAASKKYEDSALRVLRMAFLSSAAIDFFSTIIIAGVAIVIGLSLIGYVNFDTAEKFTLTSGLTLLLVVPEFFAALKKLGVYYHDRSRAIGAMMSFQRKDIFTNVKRGETQAKGHEAGKAVSLMTGAGEFIIDVRNLHFGYPGGKPVFNDFSLSLKQGEKVWIKGASGSGKSTLLDLIHGFRFPVKGTVTIAGNNTRQVSPEQLSEIIGWAGQKSRIFRGTLRYNLCMAKELTDTEIISILHDYLDWTSFIAPYEEGLDTLIEEDGKSLSGGERHKVSLARVLLKQAPVLLLDEPCTHLDRDSAIRLMNALSVNAQQRTIILVSHQETDYTPVNFKQAAIHDQF
ncbi:ABC transporter ATP-binding protein/permease [Mucilaginibacter angelicae]|uniref:ABC transporter ATP-binding protein/permease n=1 Tax=Mucilaginibacter angelicae TaxID=869718 RepID=A0ABV6L2Z1_9SPHI